MSNTYMVVICKREDKPHISTDSAIVDSLKHTIGMPICSGNKKSKVHKAVYKVLIFHYNESARLYLINKFKYKVEPIDIIQLHQPTMVVCNNRPADNCCLLSEYNCTDIECNYNSIMRAKYLSFKNDFEHTTFMRENFELLHDI